MNIWEKFVVVAISWKVPVLVVTIIADWVLGILVAIKEKQFAFQKVANFVNSSILFYGGGYLVISLLSMADPQYTTIQLAILGLIEVSLGSSIIAKLNKLGLNLPKQLAK
jgi:hypothetical protein